jgi:hypothetical protein
MLNIEGQNNHLMEDQSPVEEHDPFEWPMTDDQTEHNMLLSEFRKNNL